MRLALFLTLFRLFISPIFLVVYLYYPQLGLELEMLPFALFGLLTLCELTDIFDGVVARRSNEVTDLGKILDPMADSVVRISFLLTLTQGIVKLPLMLVLVFIYRDAITSTLRILCALRGHAMAARMSGKLKAIIQAVSVFAIIALIIPYSRGLISLEQLRNISYYIVLVAAIYTVASGIEYLVANRFYISKSWRKV